MGFPLRVTFLGNGDRSHPPLRGRVGHPAGLIMRTWPRNLVSPKFQDRRSATPKKPLEISKAAQGDPMSNVLAEVRPWLELAFFIGGVVVAAVGLYGLQQIRLMKRDMEMRSQRAAREKAIEYISRYFARYVPLDACFTDEAHEKKLPGYDGPVGDFTMSSLTAKHDQRALKRFVLDSWLPALNELHTIAAAFAYGVADEELGFQAIGRTFCATVASKYDILCIARRDRVCQHYQGIVDLFRLWTPRLSKSELSALREQVDRRITALADHGGSKSEKAE